jgi:hypothetical protein
MGQVSNISIDDREKIMIRKCSFLLALCVLFSTAAAQTGSFKGPLALQLYSLRAELKKDVPGTLAKVKAMGFRNVEMGGYYGLTPQQFRAELDKAGLKAVSMHADFNLLDKEIDRVIAEAKVFEVSYVGCAWIPHGKDFTPADVTRAAEVFNRAAARLQGARVQVHVAHIHGYEFVKDGEGTLFDRLAAATDARHRSISRTTSSGRRTAERIRRSCC